MEDGISCSFKMQEIKQRVHICIKDAVTEYCFTCLHRSLEQPIPYSVHRVSGSLPIRNGPRLSLRALEVRAKTTAVWFQVEAAAIVSTNVERKFSPCLLSLCQQAEHSKLFCPAASLNSCYSTSAHTSARHAHISPWPLRPSSHPAREKKKKTHILL